MSAVPPNHSRSFAFFIGAVFFAIFFSFLLRRCLHLFVWLPFVLLRTDTDTHASAVFPLIRMQVTATCVVSFALNWYEIRFSILITRHHIDIWTECRKSSTKATTDCVEQRTFITIYSNWRRCVYVCIDSTTIRRRAHVCVCACVWCAAVRVHSCWRRSYTFLTN